MNALALVRRFANFVRQGYPRNVSTVGHCSLIALMPGTAQPDQIQTNQN